MILSLGFFLLRGEIGVMVIACQLRVYSQEREGRIQSAERAVPTFARSC